MTEPTKIPCPLCGSQEFVLKRAAPPMAEDRGRAEEVYRSASDQTLLDPLVECGSCDLLYLNPRPPAEWIESGYREAVDPEHMKQNEERIRTFKRSLEKIVAQTGLDPKGKKLLDIGCASGSFVKAAVDAGFDAFGIEPSQYLCEAGRTAYGLDLRPGLLQEHRLESASLDVVSLWDVVEHLTDPVSVLRECHRILKPNGILILNYPNHSSIARRLLRGKWPFYLSVHLLYFTPRTLEVLCGKAGFAVETSWPHWQTLKLGYAMKRAAGYISALKPIAGLMENSSANLTYNLGQTLVIARRKG